MLRLSVVVCALLVSAIGQATADEAEPQDNLTQAEQSLELLDQIDQANKEGDTGRVAELVAAIRKAMTANWVRLPPSHHDVDNPDETRQTVKGHIVPVDYHCDPKYLKGHDVWVAIRPLANPDQIWLQGSAVVTNFGQAVVYLGTEGKLPRSEKFQVLLITMPMGKYEKPVAIKTYNLKRNQIAIIAHLIIQRDE